MKPTKKYRVAYEFHGGGNIIVESTSMAKAEERAQEVLRQLIPNLRPSTAKVYKSRIDIIPNDSDEVITRQRYQDDARGESLEPFDGTTPTHIHNPF